MERPIANGRNTYLHEWFWEVDGLRKGVGDLLYVHMNASERFVMFGGLDFQGFYGSLSQPLQNILLLKHRYKDAEYNMHTALEYVEQENVPKLVKLSLIHI